MDQNQTTSHFSEKQSPSWLVVKSAVMGLASLGAITLVALIVEKWFASYPLSQIDVARPLPALPVHLSLLLFLTILLAFPVYMKKQHRWKGLFVTLGFEIAFLVIWLLLGGDGFVIFF